MITNEVKDIVYYIIGNIIGSRIRYSKLYVSGFLKICRPLKSQAVVYYIVVVWAY